MANVDGSGTPYGLYEPRREHDSCGVGAVVNVSGRADHAVVEYGREVLLNLRHRGAAGSDETTGDGAGIMIQVPHAFFAAECERLGFSLPEAGRYGAGMVFGPMDGEVRGKCLDALAAAAGHYGLRLLGVREVPVRPECLGAIALASRPDVRQVFIDGAGLAGEELERRLFLVRKRAERLVREGPQGEGLGAAGEEFYVPSLSARTITYKGMFMARQLFDYYPDLADERVVTALAVVHQRYSTNTLPSWRLAQPLRMLAHNGEINTLSGNRNRIRAREMKMTSQVLGDLTDVFPVIAPGGSDSAQFDNVLELLVRAGRPLPHVMMMMIPEAFGPRYHMSTDRRAFYEYHAAVCEPWDGPAAMVFTDGRLVGATLDRNGLRPCRYVVTDDGLVVLASEAGVVEFPPERIRTKGRLQPGRMFLVDTRQGRIISDNEVKSKIARRRPYRRWLAENRIELGGLFDTPPLPPVEPAAVRRRMRAFGYTREELRMVLAPMALDAQEPVGSMGNDTPLAVLADGPKGLFAYFKQLFAQVTNPPIDPLREGLVMSLMLFAGERRNLLEETPHHCRQLKLPHPILTNEETQRLRAVRREDFKVVTIPALFDARAADAGAALKAALDELADAAAAAIAEGSTLLIISDRDVSADRAAIPSLLATAALHTGLSRRRLRAEVGLVVETGEAREVMHFCLLAGYGANAVNPYLALDAIEVLRRRGELGEGLQRAELVDNYVAAVKKGILKTMAKMGISTLRSYRSAQLFEAIGLARGLVDAYFPGTSSRIEGIGLAEVAEEAIRRHRSAFEEGDGRPGGLDYGGEYHYRADGEHHLWNPTTIALLRQAAMRDDAEAFARFSAAVDDQSRRLATLRGLFEFVPGEPAPIEEVEPAAEIVKRFCTGAMSHGSISKEAHECLAVAMNRLGAMSNTGEGGEDPERFRPAAGEDSRNCAIKQVASARFGVTIDYLAHARELQIKMAQGAKPGEGGQLPGHKVTDEIAALRHSTAGVTLISPPPHHDIYSIEDLAQLIHDLRCANPAARVSVKLVSEVGVGTIAAGVAKGCADEVLISGHDGGTGASPLSSIKHAGCPWELGLAETQQVLVMNGLRGRIRVQVDGQLKTGRDVVVGALLGAERFGFGTAALVSLGCVLLRKCHLGACPMGIGTQEPLLRSRFAGEPEYVQRFMLFVAREVRRIMAGLGFRKFDDMVGRVDRLNCRAGVEHWKARGLDFAAVFARPAAADLPGRPADAGAVRCVRPPAGRLAGQLDWKVLEAADPVIASGGGHVALEMPIRNVDRTVGAILSNRVVLARGPAGLPDGTIECTFRGSAGQSFGAFLAPGVTLRLIGDANDYLGKGLSGGRIVVVTPPEARFDAGENVIAGNTLLYGATAGEVFINGVVGERFAVRNSGAVAVVEGVGDHGCEYMTGGTVVVMGQTGRNFAAGMSGGVAYVLDEHQLFDTLCNLDMVDVESVWQDADKELLHDLVARHHAHTASRRAQWLLENWPEAVAKFVKVMPIDYRKALQRLRDREERDTDTTPATEEVFRG